MSLTRRIFAFGALGAVLSGCASTAKSYQGPEVTHVVVYKSSRKMYLLSGKTAIKSYRIDLGFAPVGDKKVAGDGKTPEGRYFIDRRNPNSRFHLSLGISYPNASDVAEARKLGASPGGDIYIHGIGPVVSGMLPDWTWGCIAVTNEEIEEIYAMVPDGTPISIYK